MNAAINRRTFAKQTIALGAGVAAVGAPALQAADSPGEKIVVGVMGLGRGKDHINALLQIANVEIAYVSDIDDQRMAQGAKIVADKQDKPPKPGDRPISL